MIKRNDIALELVPKDLVKLTEQSKEAQDQYGLEIVNIPEIRSLEIKSFAASLHLLQNGIRALPHFRTVDRSAGQMADMLDELVDAGLREVLFISGDPDEEGYDSGETPISMVKALKNKFPQLKFYAGMDPYRSSIQKEVYYCQEKMDAGYDGFFTQPFFHESLLDVYLDYLHESTVFAGICPVASENSKKYWEEVNKVVFPNRFEANLVYNVKLAHNLLHRVEQADQKAYLMPITISPAKFLGALFSE
jgi:methylenetetrahydrofolate reductase (NADPH)